MKDREKYYQGKYRIHSARLEGYDYKQNGSYFVTFCTKDFTHCLGVIQDAEIYLSKIGEICVEEICRTSEIRKNVVMECYCIMPNHIHMIISIQQKNSDIRRDSMLLSSSGFPKYKNTFGPQCDSLGTIVGGLKRAITSRARIINPGFARHRSYYEHIVRNQFDSDRIKEYIMTNPQRRDDDKFYSM